MIELKTAVLLAASLQMGALAAGASDADQQHIYAFGKNLGLAFQVQDDWLDTFGNPEKFGKQKGGDILANKKTFLLVNAIERSGPAERSAIEVLLQSGQPDKVELMIGIYQQAGVDLAAQSAKQAYMETAFRHLKAISVPEGKKLALQELAEYLLEREA